MTIIDNRSNNMKEIANYMNGNVHIILYDNGTRIMDSGNSDTFNFAFPTNVDMTITKRCDGHCPWCYLGCTESGKHADLFKWEFLNHLHKGTEMAINLNDLTHPQLTEFLYKMKNNGVFVNGTINQRHFEKNFDKIKYYTDNKLLNGVGISLAEPTDKFITLVQKTPNAIIHIINGLFTTEDYIKLINKGLKLLILGYKSVNRGNNFLGQHEEDVKENMDFLYSILPQMMNEFSVISFDNLAIEQLIVKDFVPQKTWDMFYQGDDGTSTFAIDLVDGVFSKNSMSETTYPIMNSIDDMFNKIKE